MSKPQLIENPEDIQLREQYEIQQVMGKPPGWILRWGITIAVFFFIIIAIVGWIVEYSDKVQAQVVLITKNPPLVVNAPSDGKIIDILFEDKDTILRGNLLAIMENTAELSDVRTLETFLDKVENVNSPAGYLNCEPTKDLTLGVLQSPYSELVMKLRGFIYYFNKKPYRRHIRNLRDQIHSFDILNDQTLERIALQEEEVEYAAEDTMRFLKLLNNGAGSEVEFEAAKLKWLNARRELEGLKMSIPDNYIKQAELERQISDFLLQDAEDIEQYEIDILNATLNLKSEIETWKQNNLIFATENGRLDRSLIWNKNKYVQKGESIFTIVPFENQNVENPDNTADNEVIGRAFMPVARSGKVESGMPVNIHLLNYPSREYGMVIGKVRSISILPQGDNSSGIGDKYLVELSLEEGLKTTYDTIIPFQQGMQGNCDIITQKRRFWERIFDKILDLVKNR